MGVDTTGSKAVGNAVRNQYVERAVAGEEGFKVGGMTKSMELGPVGRVDLPESG